MTILIAQLLLKRACRRLDDCERTQLYAEWMSEVRNVLADPGRCSTIRTTAGVLRFAAGQTPVCMEAIAAARSISARAPRWLAVVGFCFSVVVATIASIIAVLAAVAPLVPDPEVNSSVFEYLQVCCSYASVAAGTALVARLFAGAVASWRAVMNAVEVVTEAIAVLMLGLAVVLTAMGLRGTPVLMSPAVGFAWLAVGVAGGVGHVRLITHALARMSETLAHGITDVRTIGFVELEEAVQ